MQENEASRWNTWAANKTKLQVVTEVAAWMSSCKMWQKQQSWFLITKHSRLCLSSTPQLTWEPVGKLLMKNSPSVSIGNPGPSGGWNMTLSLKSYNLLLGGISPPKSLLHFPFIKGASNHLVVNLTLQWMSSTVCWRPSIGSWHFTFGRLVFIFYFNFFRDWLEMFKPTTFHVGGDEVQ